MLLLNVERADLVCATHGEHARASGHTEHHASAHSHAVADVGRLAADSDQCQTPAQPDCCEALVSCSMILGLTDEREMSSAMQQHPGIVVAISTAPHSRNTAPEPPPPKA